MHETAAIVISDAVRVENGCVMVTPWSPPEHRRQYNARFPLPLRQFNGISRQVVRDHFEHRVELTQNQSKCLNDGDGTRTDCFNASFGASGGRFS
jgi:hypothetical protein